MPLRRRRISRRRFLTTGAAALAGAAALRTARARETERPPASTDTVPPAGNAPEAPAIPPPIRPSEFAERQAAVRKAMGDFIDAVILPPGPSMLYLSGLTLSRRERLVALMLFREGSSLVLCSDHEQDAVRAAPVPIDRVVVWDEGDVPGKVIGRILKDARLADKRVALGPTLWYDDMATLYDAMPSLQFISASTVIAPLRERKSEAERALVRAASLIAQHAIAGSWDDVKEGITERDLADRVVARCDGGDHPTVRALFGESTADRHAASTDRRLAAGDPLVLDCAVQVHGYWGRVARSAVLGKPSGRMTLIQGLIEEARARALKAAKPDVGALAVYQHARGALGSHGLSRHVPGRLGQGLGLEAQESPWISNAGAERLAEGNVFTFEPGIDTPGEYGLRSVDVMEIAPAGGRFFTEPPESLLEL